MGKQPAKVLEPEDICRVLKKTEQQRHVARNKVMILLSFKAGLRACEIAGLDWSRVLRSNGKTGSSITICKSIAKRGSGRTIPMNSDLHGALKYLHSELHCPITGPVIRSERGQHMTARSVVNWFSDIYAQLGLRGCSSHSGRRTFITRAARELSKTGGSLRDVQELAGHRALTTTERYIQGNRDAQRQLVGLI
ncbi:tyrosine-type recombinase/integrase [Parasedimentitalea maritima]|uniref:Tyrosine-type recombinase/integrase n=1 Tax=Parasedimentitalea maritima TaxID=2578117 RepID=A0A6A4R8E2_9RHOB|nr:tyrosine-type recombinase/integrase [Zongyanglinia marina]